MAKQVRTVLQMHTLEAIADRGYFSSPEILACHEAGITVTLPKPLTSARDAPGVLAADRSVGRDGLHEAQ